MTNKLLSNINIYSYDYKYGLYSNHPHQYGFLIDEIEEQNGYSDFFNFHEEKGFVQDGFINHNMDDWKKGAQIIKLKKYDTDVLDKYLLTCVKALQNKIDKLIAKSKVLESEGAIVYLTRETDKDLSTTENNKKRTQKK